jgi:hypothetical protein
MPCCFLEFRLERENSYMYILLLWLLPLPCGGLAFSGLFSVYVNLLSAPITFHVDILQEKNQRTSHLVWLIRSDIHFECCPLKSLTLNIPTCQAPRLAWSASQGHTPLDPMVVQINKANVYISTPLPCQWPLLFFIREVSKICRCNSPSDKPSFSSQHREVPSIAQEKLLHMYCSTNSEQIHLSILTLESHHHLRGLRLQRAVVRSWILWTSRFFPGRQGEGGKKPLAMLCVYDILMEHVHIMKK